MCSRLRSLQVGFARACSEFTIENETIFGCFPVVVFIPMEVCIEFLKSVFSVLCFIEVYWGLNLRT